MIRTGPSESGGCDAQMWSKLQPGSTVKSLKMRFQPIKTISLAGLTIHQLSETALMYSRLLVGCGPRGEVFQGDYSRLTVGCTFLAVDLGFSLSSARWDRLKSVPLFERTTCMSWESLAVLSPFAVSTRTAHGSTSNAGDRQADGHLARFGAVLF